MRFVVKDQGEMSKFLGIRVTQSENFIAIDQELLINETLEKYGMTDCNAISTPAEVAKGQERDDGMPDMLATNCLYRALVGSSNCIADVSRPDITYAVNKLSRKLENLTNKDWIAAKRVLRYLNGTKGKKSIKYKKEDRIILDLYTNADFAGSEDKKSTS